MSLDKSEFQLNPATILGGNKKIFVTVENGLYTVHTGEEGDINAFPRVFSVRDMAPDEMHPNVKFVMKQNLEMAAKMDEVLRRSPGDLKTEKIYPEDHESDKRDELNNVLAKLGTPSVIPYNTYVQAKNRILANNKKQSKCSFSGPLINIRPHTVKKTVKEIDPETGKEIDVIKDTGEVNAHYLEISRDFDAEVIVNGWETGVSKGFWSDTFDYVKAEWSQAALELKAEFEGTVEFVEEQWRDPDSVLYDEGLFLPVGGLTIRSKPPREYANDLLVERGFNFEFADTNNFDENRERMLNENPDFVELFFPKGDKTAFKAFIKSDYFKKSDERSQVSLHEVNSTDLFRERIGKVMFNWIADKTIIDIQRYEEDWKDVAPHSKEEADSLAAELGDKYKKKFFDPFRNLVGRDVGAGHEKQLIGISPTKQQMHRNEELINLKRRQLEAYFEQQKQGITTVEDEEDDRGIPIQRKIEKLYNEIAELENDNDILLRKKREDEAVTQQNVNDLNSLNKEIDVLIRDLNAGKIEYEKLKNDVQFLESRGGSLTQKESQELVTKRARLDELKKELENKQQRLDALENSRDSKKGVNSPGQITKQLYQKALADRNLVKGMLNKIGATAADNFDESLCCLIKRFVLPAGTWDVTKSAWSHVFAEKRRLDERLKHVKTELEDTEKTLKRIVLLMKMLFQEVVLDGEAIVKMISSLISPIIQGIICSLLVGIRSLISALVRPIVKWIQQVASDSESCFPLHAIVREILDTIEKLYRRLKSIIIDFAKTLQLRISLPKEIVVRKAHKNRLRYIIRLIERDILSHIDLFENWIDQMLKFDVETEAQNFVDNQVTSWLQRNGYDTHYNRATGQVEKINNILSRCGDRPGAKPFKPKPKEKGGGGLNFVLAEGINISKPSVQSMISAEKIHIRPSPDIKGIKKGDFVSISSGSRSETKIVESISNGVISVDSAFMEQFYAGDRVVIYNR